MPTQLQTADPDFIPASPTPPTTQAPTANDPDFIPASPLPNASTQASKPDPDFIPVEDRGEGWTDTIWNGIKNMGYNTVVRPYTLVPQLAQDVYMYSWGSIQSDIRKNLEGAALPFANPEDVEKHIETTPDEGVVTSKGAWEAIKSGANVPLAGKFHRKEAGAIESETEDWITSQINPLNIGLAAATMGSSAVEGGLVKLGLTATKAAGIVRYTKLAADIGFLSKFGYSTYTEAIPQLEQDWKDYNNAADKDKAALLEKMEREGTDIVLGSIAMGLASRGIQSGIHDIRTNSPKGKAIANTEYNDAIHEYQSENQHGSAQANQVHIEGLKAVPDNLRQEAISNNVEAESSLKQLREWEAKAADEHKPGYQAAQQLTEKEITLRDRLKSMLDAWKERLRAQNLLAPDGGRDNYVPHRPVFEDTDPVTGDPISRTAADAERDFLKKRIYDSHFDGEQAGINYKTKNFTNLVADYIERASNMIAKNNLGEQIAQAHMNEGSPMAVSGGYLGHPADAFLEPADIQQLKAKGQLDGLLKSGRVYEVTGPEADAIRQARAATPGQNNFRGIVKANPEAIGEYNPLSNRRVIPAPEPIYKWKFSDYRDSGLRINRPLAAQPAGPGNAIVPHPDMNAFPGEALIRQGQGGIPTDPRTGQAMTRVPVFVHPEIMPHLDAVLGATAPKNAIVRGMLKASSFVKGNLLSLSPFHWATVTSRLLEANPTFQGIKSIGKNFANAVSMPTPIDYFNLTPEQTAAINDGIVVANTRPGFSGYTEEGNVGHGALVNKVPILGKVNQWLESRLFGPQGYITGMKFDLYDKIKTELMKSQPQLTETAAGRIAAEQVNNKFGGLNYTLMGRSAGSQAAMRAFLLAPDFLESTGRSVLDLAGPHGGNLVKAFVGFNVLHYMMARAMNYVVNGEYHPESGLKVLSKDGKKEYGLRTTLGDFLHFAETPRDFMMNRVNPLLVRTPMEVIQGVDAQGNKVSNDQRFWDTVRQGIPIPAQTLTPRQQITQPSHVDDLLKSFGVQSTKKFSPAETLAYRLATERNQRAPLEGDALLQAQTKFKLADDLRSAISTKDAKGIADSTQAIIKATKGQDALLNQKQATDMINEAHTMPNRLASTVFHLPLEDALTVYEHASLSEKQALRQLMNQKIMKFNQAAMSGKKPIGQYKAVKPRIDKFFAEKP